LHGVHALTAVWNGLLVLRHSTRIAQGRDRAMIC
jgi:hypothetical protein